MFQNPQSTHAATAEDALSRLNVAEELGSAGYNTDKNRKRNEGAYIMDSSYSDMNKLLSRSRNLVEKSRKEVR